MPEICKPRATMLVSEAGFGICPLLLTFTDRFSAVLGKHSSGSSGRIQAKSGLKIHAGKESREKKPRPSIILQDNQTACKPLRRPTLQHDSMRMWVQEGKETPNPKATVKQGRKNKAWRENNRSSKPMLTQSGRSIIPLCVCSIPADE